MMQLQAINEQEAKVVIDIKDEFKICIRDNEEFATTYKNALGEFLDKLEEFKI
jgi:hypothetical protein